MNMINYQTPCFILDEAEFHRNVDAFQMALHRHFDDSIIGFSVKTNSFPYLLRLACEHNCYAEVVSYTEYELALMCGFSKERVIYNGPMKSEDTFVDALEHGAIVNIETQREIEWLRHLDRSKHYRVGIRLNVNISEISPADAKHEEDDSRFGFSEENGEFEKAITAIEQLSHVSIRGLHIHRTSLTRSVDFYRHLVRYGASVVVRHGLHLDYIDVGGGYFGIFSNKPSYEDYSRAIADELRQYGLDTITVIVEPGNALTASLFEYRSTVIDTKQVGNTRFVTTDGTRNDVDPLFQKTDYIKQINYQSEGITVPKQVVTGCTCLEFDRLFTLHDEPRLGIGDMIIYKNVGAYTMCLSPLFIRYIPRVYSKQSGELLRKEWTAAEYVAQCKM